MEESYYPLSAASAWNSSFEDNDASTTLDTSIETANDSSMALNHFKLIDSHQHLHHEDHFGHHSQHKFPISRSSPGAPLSKEYHSVHGYFDDVESYTSNNNVISIKNKSDQSIQSLHPCMNIHRTHGLHQKGSSIDTAVPGDDQKISGISVDQINQDVSQGLNQVSKPPSELVTLEHSSPVLGASAIQASDFVSSRRNARSHTSQGIPSHILLNGLESITEVNKGGDSIEKQVELQSENETLRQELEETRIRLSELEGHMNLLAIRLKEDSEKETFTKKGIAPVLAPPSPNPMLNFPMPPYTMTNLIASGPPHFIDTRGHGTSDSASLTNMSMTPDPFSPFQRFHPHYHKSVFPHGAPIDPSMLQGTQHRQSNFNLNEGNDIVDKGSKEGRFDRGGSRLAMQDLHMPVDLLITKTLGSRSQDASIALQQQLKTANPARKAAIIEAMTSHVVRLSEDKHGNFLVQRAIGVDPSLAWELKGHFVDLSLSQFGCHVVQRVLDEEKFQSTIVEELLSKRILDTLTCRNSIHVWQKVLEINWKDKSIREKIFTAINSVMKGRWAETAMQETGSIICQNIFESADGTEKDDCVTEILANLCECAANQWGVWVVQHIIEHGEGEHRRIAFDTLLSNAVNLTLSQYGQKAIMSALKSQDVTFINAYIDLLCDRDVNAPSTPEANNGPTLMTSHSRRSVLVDISSAPQGVQIITQLLTSVPPTQRDRIIKSVRKNSVFLKGSKAGLRVHQLCERARAFTGY